MRSSRAASAAMLAALLGATVPPERTRAAPACPPTREDALGPFYQPGAPVRSKVGSGYRLRGTVRSSADCRPIPAARVELWLAGRDGYDDAHRATVIADDAGEYLFESDPPRPFERRPPHIHVRVAHRGYETLVTQHYPAPRQSEATFDLVLVPAR